MGEIPEGGRARQQCDARVGRERREGLSQPIGCNGAVDACSGLREQTAAEFVLFVAEHDSGAGLGRGACRGDARGARTDDRAHRNARSAANSDPGRAASAQSPRPAARRITGS